MGVNPTAGIKNISSSRSGEQRMQARFISLFFAGSTPVPAIKSWPTISPIVQRREVRLHHPGKSQKTRYTGMRSFTPVCYVRQAKRPYRAARGCTRDRSRRKRGAAAVPCGAKGFDALSRPVRLRPARWSAKPHISGHSTTASAPAFQAGYAGSIPVARSCPGQYAALSRDVKGMLRHRS